MTRRVAFNVRAECDDDFFDGFVRQTFFQFGDAQIFRFDAVERGNFSAENVKFPVIARRIFRCLKYPPRVRRRTRATNRVVCRRK